MHLPLQSNRNVDHLGERLLEEWLTNHGIITSTPVRVGSIAISLSIYLSVCLSARIYQKPHVQISPIFFHVNYGRGLVVLDGNAISYVLPVLWMTSFFT